MEHRGAKTMERSHCHLVQFPILTIITGYGTPLSWLKTYMRDHQRRRYILYFVQSSIRNQSIRPFHDEILTKTNHQALPQRISYRKIPKIYMFSVVPKFRGDVCQEPQIRSREPFHVNFSHGELYKKSTIPTCQRLLNDHFTS